MLQVFRESIGRYVAIAILGLIAVTFVFFGIDFTSNRSTFAAKVNGESIPVQEFDRQFQNYQRDYQQAVSVELTDEIRVQLRRTLIDQMVLRKVLRQRAEESGLRVSDERLSAELTNNPTFQVNGQFSPDIFVSTLTAAGITPVGFNAQERDRLTILELQDSIFESSFITPAEFRRSIELYYERREVAYALFQASSFLDRVSISDEAVAEYFDENGASFLTEELVDIEYLELTLESVSSEVEVSEDDLRDYYEEQLEGFVSEERRVSHILIEPEGEDYAAADAEAAAVLARLEAGEDFAALAAELSDDIASRNLGGDLGFMAPGSMEGPFEDALFAMELGAIEGPVETEFGLHILKLDEIRSGDRPSFESLRDQLRSELAEDSAYALLRDRENDLANAAFAARNELAGVAGEFGLELVTIDGLSRSGAGAEGLINPGPVIEAAFDAGAIASGENSDLIELDEESVAIIRVAAHYPPEPRPLEDVRTEILSNLSLEAAQDLADEAATAFAEEFEVSALSADQGYAARLAETHGGTWFEPVWVDRSDVAVPSAIVQLVFSRNQSADSGAEVLRTSVTVSDEAIVVVTGTEPGDPDAIPSEEREQGQQELISIAAEIELNAYAANALAAATVRVPENIIDPEL
jgi:peptidyl-prolyl cis-trans isomerase D